MHQLCRVDAADIGPQDAAVINRRFGVVVHLTLFDENRGYTVTSVKSLIVSLDPVRGKPAGKADNPADRLKVAFDFLTDDKTLKVRPCQNRLVNEFLSLLAAETTFQLL